jgi:putative tricarboxylic transport membrane protein
MSSDHDKSAVSNRTMEVITAAVLGGLGGILIWDSRRIGFGWADDGPQAGYFPFYIGVILVGVSIINLISAMRSGDEGSAAFLSRNQLRMVMSLLIPTTIFVIAVKWLGIYLSSALLISWFMRRMGGFSIAKTLAVSLGVACFLFAMFEIWFGVPLPKGPIENLLGFA